MSASTLRSQLKQKRDQRVAAEKRVADLRKKEADKRSAAARANSGTRSSRSEATRKSKLREAERLERDANAAAKDVASWSAKAAGYAKEEAQLQERLGKAELSEAKTAEAKRLKDALNAERRRKADLAASEQRTAAGQRELSHRVAAAEAGLAQLRTPRAEPLRVLVLTSASSGDLRIGRETKRIRDGIRAATHRDQIQLDVRTAATIDDLLDGLTQTRPHVVHFSGHGDVDLIAFEQDVDRAPQPAVVTGAEFARALGAVDRPPLLVVLNACKTEEQARRLSSTIAEVAIGMSDSIDDADAIAYAARFYSALVDGQSVQAAHDIARAALALSGSPEPDLPVLFERTAGRASDLVLVLAPDQ